MTIKQVRDYFYDKENVSCPLTEELVKAGYQQISGGYIDRAKRRGFKVNFKENSPSQYWHLMSYCNNRRAEWPFNKSIVCGELIFWMAESSRAIEKEHLSALVEKIKNSCTMKSSERPYYDRRFWNKEIQKLCFDKIMSIINNH